MQDYYQNRKKREKKFSYRAFAQKAGFTSSGLYIDIVNKRTDIKSSFISKLSKGMEHNPKEEAYFEDMVLFNQAKNHNDKKKYFVRMMKFHNSKAYLVESSKYEFYSKWYYSAIRDMLGIGKYSDDYALIAKTMDPAIKPTEARKAIKLLLKLELIRCNDDGYYEVTENAITTGDEVASVVIKNFQKEMIQLAMDSLDKHHFTKRNISTITFNISEETFSTVQAELVSCRKRIANLVKHDKNMDRVYQLNLQLFPLTKI